MNRPLSNKVTIWSCVVDLKSNLFNATGESYSATDHMTLP